MCNSYKISKSIRQRENLRKIDEVITWAEAKLIRPTTQGPVLLEDDNARMMRWGFERAWAKSINNARTDKLKKSMWTKAFENRRCLIPMSGFYEYTGPAGNKRAHLFQPVDPDEWLWAAGIWEPHPEHGDCYSMLMTEAAGIVIPIHNRMPVLVNEMDGLRYLRGDFADLDFSPVAIVVSDAVNPLKRKPPPPVQQDLLN